MTFYNHDINYKKDEYFEERKSFYKNTKALNMYFPQIYNFILLGLQK